MKAIRRDRRVWGIQAVVVTMLCAWLFCSNSANGQDQAADAAATPTPVKTPSKMVDISAENFNFNRAQKIITYSGNVKVVQQDTTLFSDQLEAYLDEGGRQIAKAVATGNVRIASSSGMATGEQGTFFNTEQKIELVGNAKVWQENNTVTAERIVAFLQEKVVEAYANEANEKDRVTMTIYSSGEFANPFDSMMPGAAATPAPAAKTTPTPSASKPEKADAAQQTADTPVPMVITSKTLRLNNTEQKAVFTGNVIVKKPPTELLADEMIVYIAKTSDNRNDIDKIEVAGHVKITHETTVITGETGEFLNQTQKATVRGTSEKKARVEDSAQKLTMDALVITADLETGEIGAKTAETQPEEQGAEQEPGKERIHMQFGVDDAETLVDQPKQPAAAPTMYVITEESIAKFRLEKIPDTVINKLAPLKDQLFSREHDFVEALDDAIGKDQTVKYKKTLLKHSVKAEKTTAKEDNPSVTIYPQKPKEKSK